MRFAQRTKPKRFRYSEWTNLVEKKMTTPATALRTASYHGDQVVVRNLLSEGVDSNVADAHGRTALTLAAGQGHTVIVDLLLAGGAWADPHEDYDIYETPLMAAVIGGHLEIVKKLIEGGANQLFCVGVGQRTAEAHARSYGHTDIARYLAERLSK